MEENVTRRVLDVVAQLPEFSDVAEDLVTLNRMGGLTNLVFKAETPGRAALIVRIPGAGTESYIDRRSEIANAHVAARAGVAPPVIMADPASGLMVTQCISNIVTMTPEQFAARIGAPGRAGIALRQLHEAGEPFMGRFELFAMIEDYLAVLTRKQAVLPEGYHDLVARARPVGEALMAHPAPLRPCHCDPLCENFLDDGARMWIVDYEYGGMNDPMWDLGDLAVEGHFDDAMEAEMLMAYFGRQPTAAETGRVVIYKAMCDLLWTLWGLIQHADANPADDFWAYATARFARCKTLMDQPSFAAHVEAVRRG